MLVFIYICIYVYMYVYIYVYTYVHIFSYTNIHLYTYMYMYRYIYVYTCIYTYIQIGAVLSPLNLDVMDWYAKNWFNVITTEQSVINAGRSYKNHYAVAVSINLCFYVNIWLCIYIHFVWRGALIWPLYCNIFKSSFPSPWTSVTLTLISLTLTCRFVSVSSFRYGWSVNWSKISKVE
jgi:hypothetical protein